MLTCYDNSHPLGRKFDIKLKLFVTLLIYLFIHMRIIKNIVLCSRASIFVHVAPELYGELKLDFDLHFGDSNRISFEVFLFVHPC